MSGIFDFLFGSSSASDISSDPFEASINPANGLPMVGGMGGVDIEGNLYGTDFSSTSSLSGCDLFDSTSSSCSSSLDLFDSTSIGCSSSFDPFDSSSSICDSSSSFSSFDSNW